MSLPTEILDLILSFLQEDNAALRACSRSHPILYQLAERYAYAHITVSEEATIESGIQAGLKLTVVLSRRPHIANYVRSLEIKITSSWCLSFSIFPSLPFLTKITLSSRDGFSQWWSLPESFRKEVIGALHLPSIKGISIMWITGFPLSVLNSCNKVKHLTLEGCTLDGVDRIAPDDVNRPLLESLSIKACDKESLDRLINWAPLSSLRALEFSNLWNSGDYAKVPKLLSNASTFLTSLYLNFGTCFRQLSIFQDDDSRFEQFKNIPFTLSSLTRLEHLTICANLSFVVIDGIRSYSAIPALTAFIKTAPSLKHLKLALKFVLNVNAHIPKPLEYICFTLVGLLTECRATSISLCISAICDRDRGFDATFLEMVLSAMTGCAGLNQLVGQGVLVITATP